MGLLGVVCHAADGIVELMGLIHHGHMTCVWSRLGLSATWSWTRPPRRLRDRGLDGTDPPRSYDLCVDPLGLVRHAADEIMGLLS